ncbi:Hypothetical_protein [Hexamita inflata]|uniref:Hypothetical_protein n=1 Tax=Hexamita inflata TaxID=28002 RepID=A0AA86UGQ8_9EUKA|nr:Hypothetical protein HINF_LOCUS42854 [Hexamita inflata]
MDRNMFNIPFPMTKTQQSPFDFKFDNIQEFLDTPPGLESQFSDQFPPGLSIEIDTTLIDPDLLDLQSLQMDLNTNFGQIQQSEQQSEETIMTQNEQQDIHQQDSHQQNKIIVATQQLIPHYIAKQTYFTEKMIKQINNLISHFRLQRDDIVLKTQILQNQWEKFLSVSKKYEHITNQALTQEVQLQFCPSLENQLHTQVKQNNEFYYSKIQSQLQAVKQTENILKLTQEKIHAFSQQISKKQMKKWEEIQDIINCLIKIQKRMDQISTENTLVQNRIENKVLKEMKQEYTKCRNGIDQYQVIQESFKIIKEFDPNNESAITHLKQYEWLIDQQLATTFKIFDIEIIFDNNPELDKISILNKPQQVYSDCFEGIAIRTIIEHFINKYTYRMYDENSMKMCEKLLIFAKKIDPKILCPDHIKMCQSYIKMYNDKILFRNKWNFIVYVLVGMFVIINTLYVIK